MKTRPMTRRVLTDMWLLIIGVISSLVCVFVGFSMGVFVSDHSLKKKDEK